MMNENQFLTPHNVMWTFGGCLAIYFVTDGIIEAVPALLEAFFDLIGGGRRAFNGIAALLPQIAKIVVGVVLFNRVRRELLH